MTTKLIHFPSLDGPQYDFVALAPVSMSLEHAAEVANAVIRKQNADPTSNHDVSVLEKIETDLSQLGFVLSKPREPESKVDARDTIAWDARHPPLDEMKATRQSLAAKRLVEKLGSKSSSANKAKPN